LSLVEHLLFFSFHRRMCDLFRSAELEIWFSAFLFHHFPFDSFYFPFTLCRVGSRSS
jgi:hypothetical protein